MSRWNARWSSVLGWSRASRFLVPSIFNSVGHMVPYRRFSQACVKSSVNTGGVSSPLHAGIHTPWTDTHPPLDRQIHPPLDRHTHPWTDRHKTSWTDTPWTDTPWTDTLLYADPPWADTAWAETPLERHTTPKTATVADGMNPTGMHSCVILL